MTKKAPMQKKPAARPARVLRAGEKPSVTCVNTKGKAPIVIVCDHASNRMPRALKNLGLTAAQRKMHIAWDPGTATIGRALSRALDAPLVLANYSRLVVDLNRGEDHPDCMRDTSDRVRIPGNVDLSRTQKDARLKDVYWPYHTAVAARLEAIEARGQVPLLLSVHSFTPQMNGESRPWHIGIMWNRQEKLSKRLVARLRRDNPALVIGENQPYSLKKDIGGKNTIDRHCEAKGRPYLIFEFRQDLVGSSAADARQWADVFLRSLLPVVKDPATYRRQPVKKAVAKKEAAKRGRI